jgi:Uma2 family endonuclease
MHAELVLDGQALAQRWQELCADPDTPHYFELNQFGELILSPRPSTRHQRIASALVRELQGLLGPEAAVEIAVLTDQGVRVPDAVWMPPSDWVRASNATPLPFAPAICAEVLSPGNTRAEIEMKKGAYLRGGAREVIVVGVSGEVEFFGPEGKRMTSALGFTLHLPREVL